MTRLLRQVPFPETPEQIETRLDLAEAGAIVADRGDAPAVAIMSAED